MVTAKDIAKLREKTGLGMMECKKALEECKGVESEAIELLRKKGISKAAAKSERVTKSGLIETYLHDGKIGVLVEILTETDFVARNDDFKNFIHDVALHIAASAPKYISREDVPEAEVAKEKEALSAQDDMKGKPAEIVNKIVEGRLNKFYEEICLLEQPFIKDPEKKIGDMLTALIAKIGERIVISRFVRYQLGN